MHSHGSIGFVIQSEKQQVNQNGTSSIVKVGTCNAASVATYTPALGTAYSVGSAYKLSSIEKVNLQAGLTQLTLTYTTSGETTPSTSYSEQSSTMEVPIQQHPDFADWSEEWDSEKSEFKPDSNKYGITSYIVGTSTASVTSYYSSMPSSDRGDIGTRQAPGGSIGGSSANWLLIGSNRGQQGNWYFKQNTYLYSAKAWNTDIYS